MYSINLSLSIALATAWNSYFASQHSTEYCTTKGIPFSIYGFYYFILLKYHVKKYQPSIMEWKWRRERRKANDTHNIFKSELLHVWSVSTIFSYLYCTAIVNRCFHRFPLFRIQLVHDFWNSKKKKHNFPRKPKWVSCVQSFAWHFVLKCSHGCHLNVMPCTFRHWTEQRRASWRIVIVRTILYVLNFKQNGTCLVYLEIESWKIYIIHCNKFH